MSQPEPCWTVEKSLCSRLLQEQLQRVPQTQTRDDRRFYGTPLFLSQGVLTDSVIALL